MVISGEASGRGPQGRRLPEGPRELGLNRDKNDQLDTEVKNSYVAMHRISRHGDGSARGASLEESPDNI